MNPALVVAAVVVAGLLPAAVASRKGHPFVPWWLFGMLIWVVALPYALMIDDGRPRCPDCREPVDGAAARCPHCRSEIGGRVLAGEPRRPFQLPPLARD